MRSNLSRIVLAAGLFIGGWSLSSCSQQDGSPRTEETGVANYSRVPLSLSVEAVLQPLAESSPRALSLELSDDVSKKKFPKVKGLKEGTEVLCVIRSSNPHQPVNYIRLRGKRRRIQRSLPTPLASEVVSRGHQVRLLRRRASPMILVKVWGSCR